MKVLVFLQFYELMQFSLLLEIHLNLSISAGYIILKRPYSLRKFFAFGKVSLVFVFCLIQLSL